MSIIDVFPSMKSESVDGFYIYTFCVFKSAREAMTMTHFSRCKSCDYDVFHRASLIDSSFSSLMWYTCADQPAASILPDKLLMREVSIILWLSLKNNLIQRGIPSFGRYSND